MPGKAMVAATEAMLMMLPPLPAAPAGPHGAQAVLDAERRAEEVDVEHLADLVGLDLGEQAGDLDAGVVDQDVEAAEVLDRLADGLLPAVVAGHVEGDEAVLLTQPLGDRPTGLLLEVGDHHGGAGVGQRAGHPLPEPLGPSGDQGLAAGQFEHAHGDSSGRCDGDHHTLPPLDGCQEKS